MPLINTILFDLDGTLLNTTDLIVKSFQYIAQQHLQRAFTIEELMPTFGKTLLEGLEQLAPGKSNDLIHYYREFNRQHHDDMVTVFPQVKEVLSQLKGRNKKLGIVTSKVKDTALRGLKLFDLDTYFDVIVAMEDTDKHKPNPEPVLIALDLLQSLPENSLMVGDSPHDLLCAKNAQVLTAAVSWSSLPIELLLAEEPDYVLHTMNDLLVICNS